jgi:hypothetical protein
VWTDTLSCSYMFVMWRWHKHKNLLFLRFLILFTSTYYLNFKIFLRGNDASYVL